MVSFGAVLGALAFTASVAGEWLALSRSPSSLSASSKSDAAEADASIARAHAAAKKMVPRSSNSAPIPAPPLAAAFTAPQATVPQAAKATVPAMPKAAAAQATRPPVPAPALAAKALPAPPQRLAAASAPTRTEEPRALVRDTIHSSAMAPTRAKPEEIQLYLQARKQVRAMELRTGPGPEYPLMGLADLQERYPVVEWKGRWFRIQLEEKPGHTAWVAYERIELFSNDLLDSDDKGVAEDLWR
jgi:hypothetical protein